MNKRKILHLTREEIFSLYVNEEYTIEQLADKCNCCTNIIKDILHATGLNTKEKRAYKAYKMNDECFKTIDSNIAYILGYFYNKAKIDNKLDTIRIQVAKDDDNVLYKMCDNVFGIDPKYIITKKDGKERLLIINNKKVKEDYFNLIEKNKINIAGLESELKRNFFRGYLEANSRIKFSLNRQNFNLIIDGQEEVITLFKDLMYDKFKTTKYKLNKITPKKGDTFYRYTTNKDNDILNIYYYLYREGDILFSDRHIDVLKDIFYNKVTMKLEA